MLLQSFNQDDTFYQCNTGGNALTRLIDGILYIDTNLRNTVFKDARHCFYAPFEMGKPTPKDVHWFPKVQLNGPDSAIPIAEEFIYVQCTSANGKDMYRWHSLSQILKGAVGVAL